jgi:DNA polymerase-1
MIDLLSLMGDSSDNIQGVPGVGPKKAAQYIQKYGSLEAVLEHTKDIGGKTGERSSRTRTTCSSRASS